MIRNALFVASALTFVASSANAALLITQYYEGPSTNKFIEIKNVGSTDETLSTYALGHYNNASAETYKTGGAPSFTFTLPAVTLSAGGVYLVGNTGNTAPAYAVSDTDATSNTVINFNGNDSIVLYTAGTFSTSSIIDAVGFTNAGNEGADKSFYRLNSGTGYSLDSGSDVTDFPSVWALATNQAVIDATSGDVRLGESSVVVPEPAALGVLALSGLALVRRRRA